MFKKLILCFFFVILTFSCFFNLKVSGVEILNFKDLSEDDEYYEDIIYFVKQGVIKGKEDGLFYPKDFISTAEVITITEKVLGNEKNLPKNWDWWAKPTYKDSNGWNPDWDFSLKLIMGDYTKPASRNTVACILLNTVKAPIVKPEVWGLDSYRGNENSIYFLNMVLRGYWEKDSPYYVGVSRGEFCRILRLFEENQDFLKPQNEILIDINQKYLGDKTTTEKIQHYYQVYDSIMKLPINIQKLFIKKGFSFYVVDDEYWNSYLADIPQAGGVFNYYKNTKKIIIRDLDARTVFHEFGHFIENYYYTYFERVKRVYHNDEWELIQLVNSLYPKSSVKEYFADGFAMYFLQPEQLKEKLPELYEIYDELMFEINSLDI